MQDWYLFSLLALLFMGVQRFLYKVSAERGCHTVLTTCAFMATVTVLSFIFLVVSRAPLGPLGLLVLIALINSASFTAGTVTHMEALKYIPASIVYPMIRMNAVLVVIFSILFFRDRLSPFQGAGIIVAMGVIYILARESGDVEGFSPKRKRGLFLVAFSILSGSIASVSSKFAALHTEALAFMMVTYLMGTIFTLGFRKRIAPAGVEGKFRDAMVIGAFMGLINFAGFYSFLKALSTGPLSIIVSITGMHFVIAIILSVLIYKERLNASRIAGISLAVLSILFLRI
jgi:uncharacterized membrane protein